MRISVSRKSHFNAAHRLHNSAWSDEKNFEIFGKCSWPNYHGHNYVYIVTLTGAIDPKTGYVYDLKELKDLMRKQVEDRFDHKNLNLDTEEFKQLNPTAENIVVVIWDLIREQIPSNLDISVILYETERNFVEYQGA